MIQSQSSSIFSNKNFDRFLELDNENTNLESLADKNSDESISDVQDDSNNDPNWEIKCLNYKG